MTATKMRPASKRDMARTYLERSFKPGDRVPYGWCFRAARATGLSHDHFYLAAREMNLYIDRFRRFDDRAVLAKDVVETFEQALKEATTGLVRVLMTCKATYHPNTGSCDTCEIGWGVVDDLMESPIMEIRKIAAGE